MKVTRLQLGVYANQQPFCLYLFPLVASSPSPSRTTSYQPFYRLRDIDVIFFESQTIGYLYNSGKIPQIYFDTPGYCFYERSGDIYLAARAISETGTRLGNHLLAEFCKHGRSEIMSGMADKLLESVDISRTPAVEAEFEFVAVDSQSPYTPTTSPISNNNPCIRSPNRSNSSTFSEHLSPPPINGRKRMSLEAVLDNDDNTNDRRYASSVDSPVERTVSSTGSDRGTPMIKQEPSPDYSGSEHSNPSSPNHSLRSPHSPSSSSISGVVDEESRIHKRRRVVTPAIGSNNIKVTNNPEVMEQVRNTLKLKQQQKAIIEARQQAQQQMLQQQNFVDRRHSVAGYNNSAAQRSINASSSRNTSQGTLESRTANALSKRNSVSNRSNRNSRNLSVFAPPYNDASILVSSVSPSVKLCGQNSAGLSYNMQSPISVNRSAPNRQSVSGFPLSANSAFRPTGQSLNTHSASTSASINGLISPNNIDDVRSNSISSSPLPSPHPSRMSHTNGEQPSKKSFIRLFDSFYDTVSDTRSLKTTLEDQIRKTTTLLQTLQASGSMIESLVRGHFREMQREVVNDLVALEKRLSKVEENMRSSTTVVGMSPPLDSDRRLSEISTASSDIGHSQNKITSANNVSSQYLSVSQLTNSSPPLSATSLSSGSEDSQPKDYEDILSGLKARLESLERRISVS